MITEEEKVEKIKQAFLDYVKENKLSAFDTSSYFARQIMPDESFFLRRKVIDDLIESKAMVVDNGKWVIKNPIFSFIENYPNQLQEAKNK